MFEVNVLMTGNTREGQASRGAVELFRGGCNTNVRLSPESASLLIKHYIQSVSCSCHSTCTDTLYSTVSSNIGASVCFHLILAYLCLTD